jgi:predicted HicB family RNase H-like nuclease
MTRVAPNQPKTPLRTFRIADDLYRAAKAKAAKQGETLSEVVRRLLEEYVRRG